MTCLLFFLPQRGEPWVRVCMCVCVCVSAGRNSWSTQAWVSHWRCQLALGDGKRAWVGSAVTSCPGRTSLPPSHFVSPSPPLRLCRRFIYLIPRSPPARPLFISCLSFFSSCGLPSLFTLSLRRARFVILCMNPAALLEHSAFSALSLFLLCAWFLPALPHTSSFMFRACSSFPHCLLFLIFFFFLNVFTIITSGVWFSISWSHVSTVRCCLYIWMQ